MMNRQIDPRSEPLRTLGQWAGAYLAPASVVLLALALNLYRLEGKSLWFDELGTLTGAGWGGSWLDAILRPLTIPTTPKPPLYYLLTRLFLTLGDRVFLLRLPAAWFATLAGALQYALGHALVGRRVGLLGALLLAVAPLNIRYGQEARMYAMLTFLSMLDLYLFWRAIHSGQARWWIGFTIVSLCALYTHLLALLPLASLALYGLWLLWRPPSSAAVQVRFRDLALVAAAILLAWAPMLPFLFGGLTGPEGLGGSAAADWGPSHLAGIARLFSGGTNLGAWVYALFFLLGAILLAKERRDLLLLVGLWVVLPIALLVLPPYAHHVFVRYLLFALPLSLLVVAAGMRGVLCWMVRVWRRDRAASWVQMAGTALLGSALAAMLISLNAPSIAAYYAEGKQGWRDAVWRVQDMAQPGQVILVRHIYHQVGVLFYSRLRPDGLDLARETSVRVLPTGSRAGPVLADGARGWLVVPSRDSFRPGGEFEASMLPHHHLLEPIDFSPGYKPQDGDLIAPVSFGTVSVVPIEPAPPAANQPGIDASRQPTP